MTDPSGRFQSFYVIAPAMWAHYGAFLVFLGGQHLCERLLA